ncbi:hypothetical protein CAPTEDRAFT_143482 [Capitella teleta]|uniref:Sulfatase N-terminal domain-containing protein n=1 Tax=Capitella teleta TaxID=283909 RepID=R7UC10_CAPTE|nr:hypothetical protein CAPTEDRAFT_143482 [Capitella teleta]|eukprot:ELU03905.1 hypothetical protein CAPTEDRAFT_143482 [Capitella teleta]
MDGNKERMNVLFMMMDGFRPEMGAYMHLRKEVPWLNPKVKTPNLDKLASEGMLFERAFVQFGRCTASRSSMFVGRRPDSTHVMDGNAWIRDVAGENIITLPQYFKEHGYRTYGFGKAFCRTFPGENESDKWKSWDEYWKIPHESRSYSWKSYSKENREKEPLWDDQLLDHVIDVIDEHTSNVTDPFFIFAGFKKPHLPLIVPEEYFEEYPVNETERAVNEYPPKNVPEHAYPYEISGEIFSYGDMVEFEDTWNENQKLPDEPAMNLKRAYYAGITYIDHQIGEIMKKLESSGLKKHTIIVFAADHGIHLGENGIWGKFTNFEVSTRIPLILKIPGLTKPHSKSRNFVELVDIFPTLIEAAQLPPAPMCPRDSNGWAFCTEGVSLLPLLTCQHNIPWKNRVFWQGRWEYDNAKYTAYTVRTDDYRYTEYIEHTHGAPKQWPSQVFASELYHSAVDPGENFNVCQNESYADIISELSEKLHQGWASALPLDGQSKSSSRLVNLPTI